MSTLYVHVQPLFILQNRKAVVHSSKSQRRCSLFKIAKFAVRIVKVVDPNVMPANKSKAAPKKNAAPKNKGKVIKPKPAQKKSSVKKISKGKGPGNQKKNAEAKSGLVEEDFEVDGIERFTGECVYFNR
jgi:hypothetical protein